MSQHHCSTETLNGENVAVTLGYDRALNYVFCVVEFDDCDEDVLYSNLSDPHAGTRQQDVEYFRGILTKLGITVPESMFTEVKIDQQQRAGNRTVTHVADSAGPANDSPAFACRPALAERY